MTQQEALTILKTGAPVFLTGAPGSGKTHVLNAYIQYLREHDISVAVTASTGVAATHIGGTTIHSWSGIGIRRIVSDADVDEITQKKYLHKRFREVEVLVIDEISMIDAGALDAVDKVCKAFKKNEKPFGGIQVVLVGDFFQLPPVSREEQVSFAFQSNAWKQAKPIICYLGEQHRQEDETLLSLLYAIRKGEGHEQAELLRDRLHVEFEDVVSATKLFTHNVDVDTLNQQELEKLPDDEHVFFMETRGSEKNVSKLVDSCLSPEELVLKPGAVVMCTKNNFEAGYVNGTIGEVSGFEQDTGYPIIVTNEGKEITIAPTTWAIEDGDKIIASIEQIPLRLAWAITVHKSQGMSLDAAEIDLSRAFEYGQGYVALSRVRTLSGLRLLGFNPDALAVNPMIVEQDSAFQKKSEQMQEYLATKTEEEMKKSHEVFITKAGGSIEPIDWEKRKQEQESIPTHRKTEKLLRENKNLTEIAEERGLTKETVLGHVEKLLDEKAIDISDVSYLKPRGQKFQEIVDTFQNVYDETGELHLSPVKSKLSNASYFDIQLARLFINK